MASAADTAIRSAMDQLGVAYKWGAEKAGSGFDCSGLIEYAYAAAGIDLPRTAAAQQDATKPTTKPQRGDLVFYGDPAHHVGLYLGNGQMVAAPHTGDVVKVQSVYSAGDGPTYGRVQGGGLSASDFLPWNAVPKAFNAITGAPGAILGAAGDAASGAAGSAFAAAEPLLIKTAFIIGALALFVVGSTKATSGVSKTFGVQEKVTGALS